MKLIHTLIILMTMALSAAALESESLTKVTLLKPDFATELSLHYSTSTPPLQRVSTCADKELTETASPTVNALSFDVDFHTHGLGFLPNPISLEHEKSALILPNEIDGIVSVTMYDNSGDVVDYFQYSSEKGGLLEWDLKNLEGNRVHSGLYLAVVRIVSKNGKFMKKELLVGVKE